jgi:epsilon-lactone hydrolase
MAIQVHLSGPPQYRLRIASELCQSALTVPLRRILQGPRRATWGWLMELGTELLKKHLTIAFRMRDVNEARRYLNSFVVSSPAMSQVDITPVVQKTFRGNWFTPIQLKPGVTILYFHGGGYSFYPQAYASFVALIATAAETRTFSLDYRLSPEHRFPAQLEDALKAYRWLLENGCDPANLVFAGDSAGGHLALTSLLAARAANLPLPALTIALSPATDFDGQYTSVSRNQAFDWIDQLMLTQWTNWFCDTAQLCDPLVSPVRADLRGLPPIYIQAGQVEILYDSIQAFADRARIQRADVVLESWPDMNHDFQMFGPDVPQSAKALRRLGEVIDVRVRRKKKAESLSTAPL